MTHKDRLGSFVLPTHLLEKIRNYVPPTNAVPTTSGTFTGTFDGEIWEVVKTFESSSSSSIHTVSRRGKELKCTCQGFRIHKKGYCKHTQFVAKELGL